VSYASLSAARAIRHGKRVAGHIFTHLEFTRISTVRLRAKGYDPARHMLLEFSRPELSRDSVNDPHGLSGAGVWTGPPPAQKGGFWDPRNVQLVGSEIGWLKKHQQLVATRVEQLLELFRNC